MRPSSARPLRSFPLHPGPVHHRPTDGQELALASDSLQRSIANASAPPAAPVPVSAPGPAAPTALRPPSAPTPQQLKALDELLLRLAATHNHLAPFVHADPQRPPPPRPGLSAEEGLGRALQDLGAVAEQLWVCGEQVVTRLMSLDVQRSVALWGPWGGRCTCCCGLPAQTRAGSSAGGWWVVQHSPNTPTTGLRERGNDTSKSTGRSGRQKAATRRNMRREERVTVQGPVKEQQPDGMSHRGGGGGCGRCPPEKKCGKKCRKYGKKKAKKGGFVVAQNP